MPLLPSSHVELLPGRLQGQGQVGDTTSTLIATASERGRSNTELKLIEIPKDGGGTH